MRWTAATLREIQGEHHIWNIMYRENFGPDTPRNRVERCEGARCCVWPWSKASACSHRWQVCI